MSLFHGVHPKKHSVPALILTLLFAALAGSLLVNPAAANPVGAYFATSPPPSPVVEVTELNTDTLTSTFTVQKEPWIDSYGYGADYEPNHEYIYSVSSITVLIDGKIWSHPGWAKSPITMALEGLAYGWHTLEGTAAASGEYAAYGIGQTRGKSIGSSGVIKFQVEASPPSVSILSLTDAAVGEGDFQFILQVVGTTLSGIGYSLDGEENVTVNQEALVQTPFSSQAQTWTGKITLAGLSSGSHSIIVYAEDQLGQTTASNIKEFTVEEPMVTKEAQVAPSPATWIAIAITVAAVMTSLGLAAFLFRRKSERSKP